MTDLVLADVRMPGDAALYSVHISAGRVSRLAAGVGSPGDARVLDAGGRWLIPGLWDEHVHMTQWALHANRIDLSGAVSAQDAAATKDSPCTSEYGSEPRPSTGTTPSGSMPPP